MWEEYGGIRYPTDFFDKPSGAKPGETPRSCIRRGVKPPCTQESFIYDGKEYIVVRYLTLEEVRETFKK